MGVYNFDGVCAVRPTPPFPLLDIWNESYDVRGLPVQAAYTLERSDPAVRQPMRMLCAQAQHKPIHYLGSSEFVSTVFVCFIHVIDTTYLERNDHIVEDLYSVRSST